MEEPRAAKCPLEAEKVLGLLLGGGPGSDRPENEIKDQLGCYRDPGCDAGLHWRCSELSA